MNEFLPMMQDALITIGGALITLLAAFAVRAINSYTTKLKVEATKISNDGLFTLTDNAIALVGDLATTTVTAVEQRTAAALRQAVKEGIATPDDMKQLAVEAMEEIRRQLHPQYLEAIAEVYGDTEEYLLNLIEQKVWELKNPPTLPGV